MNAAAVKKKARIRRYLPLYLMLVPGSIYLIINNYIPMAGLLIAFKKIDYSVGILKSPWVGFSNFRYLFSNGDALTAIRNTILYNLVFIVLDNLLAIGEIYFPWGKRPCHQICLYYNVHLVNYDIPLDGVFHGYDGLDDKRIDLDFCWVPLEDLKNDVKVYPQELVPYILEPKKEIVHFVSKQI